MKTNNLVACQIGESNRIFCLLLSKFQQIFLLKDKNEIGASTWKTSHVALVPISVKFIKWFTWIFHKESFARKTLEMNILASPSYLRYLMSKLHFFPVFVFSSSNESLENKCASRRSDIFPSLFPLIFNRIKFRSVFLLLKAPFVFLFSFV